MAFYQVVNKKFDYSARVVITEIAHGQMMCCNSCGLELQATDDVLMDDNLGLRHTAHFEEA